MFGTKILEEEKSKYNGNIRVLKTWGMGTYIQCNGLTQSGGIVEQIWKSTLKKIKLNNIGNVLILGLGGGTLAKLLRKKYPNAKMTGVEIDPIMIELGKKYFDLDKYDIDIKIEDALTCNLIHDTWDLVVVDLYNGDKFPRKIESKRFSSLVYETIKKGGVVVFNRLFYGDKKNEALKFGEKLKKIYKKVETFKPTANIMFFCYSQ